MSLAASELPAREPYLQNPYPIFFLHLLIMDSVFLSVINISQLKEPLTGKDEQSSGIKADRLLLFKM